MCVQLIRSFQKVQPDLTFTLKYKWMPVSVSYVVLYYKTTLVSGCYVVLVIPKCLFDFENIRPFCRYCWPLLSCCKETVSWMGWRSELCAGQSRSSTPQWSWLCAQGAVMLEQKRAFLDVNISYLHQHVGNFPRCVWAGPKSRSTNTTLIPSTSVKEIEAEEKTDKHTN